MHQTQYFRCRFRLDDKDRYVIWCSNEPDGLMESDGRILSFASRADLEEYAAARGITLQPGEPRFYDWDLVRRWCEKPSLRDVDPALLLDAWNMLSDSRAYERGSAVGLFALADRRNDPIYDKLFRVARATGAYRDPGWSKDDGMRLSQVLHLGLAHLRQRLSDTPA